MCGRQAQLEDKGRSRRELVHTCTAWSKILTQDPAHADSLSAVLDPGDHDCSAKRIPIVTPIRVRFKLNHAEPAPGVHRVAGHGTP